MYSERYNRQRRNHRGCSSCSTLQLLSQEEILAGFYLITRVKQSLNISSQSSGSRIQLWRSPTWLSRDLDEGLDAALSVVALGGERGDVVPAHRGDDVQHGLSLVGVRRNHAGEEVVARVVAELRSRRGVADLRNLWRHGGVNVRQPLNCKG